MKAILFLCALFVSVVAMSQSAATLADQADSLYQAKDYKKSNEMYLKAWKAGMKGAGNLYNAACAAALAADSESAFRFLNLSLKAGWLNISHVKQDADLVSLKKDARWESYLVKLQKKADSVEANYDKPLRAELIKIFEDDQSIRHRYVDATKKLGYKNPTVDSLVKIMIYQDSLNLLKITHILDTKGWVGSDKVGGQANQTLFLVIQHSPLKTQEKYLPMMREAVKKGNASANNLALLEDRVALGQGKKQVYGSQIYRDEKTNRFYVAPLLDPDNVDKRRAEAGLGPIAGYVKNWDIHWNVEEYKKELPRLEELSRQGKK
jgi:hypothetical protein